MKTIKFIGMALFAILMCVNFTSCSKEDGKLEDEVVDVLCCYKNGYDR